MQTIPTEEQSSPLPAGESIVDHRKPGTPKNEEVAYRQVATLRVTPSSILLAINETTSLKVEATYTDGTTGDVTEQIDWVLSSSGLGEIRRDNGLYFKAIAVGEGFLKAFLQSSFVDVPLTVISRDIESIEIFSPPLHLGVSQSITARANFADGSSRDVTDAVEWSVADSQMMEITKKPVRIVPLLIGSTMVTAKYGSVTGKSLMRVTMPQGLQTISIQLPEEGFVPLGGTAQLSLKAQFANGDEKDFTAYTRWSSSNRDHLRVSMTPGERGLGYGESLGEVSVTAQLGTLATSVNVPVSLGCVDIEILPSDAIIAYVSVPLPLIVNCVLADGTKTNKTSQADFVFSAAEASIANSGEKKGTLTATTTTTSPLSGTVFIDSLSKDFTVSVEEKPLRSLVIKGVPTLSACDEQAPIALTAEGVFGEGEAAETRDITEHVTWSSLTAATISVNNAAGDKGKVTTTGPGAATVKVGAVAIDGTLVEAEASFTIQDPTPTGVAIQAYNYNRTASRRRGTLESPPYSLPKGAKFAFAAMLKMSCGADIDVTAFGETLWTGSAALSLVPDSGSRVGTANQRSVTATVQVSYQTADMTTPFADSVSVQLTPHEVERLEVRYLSPLPDPPIAGVASPYWVERGNTTALRAVAIYTDGYEQDVTTAVGVADSDASSVSVHDLTIAWSSTTPEYATVDSSGVVTGLAEGGAMIQATLSLDYNDIARTDPEPLVATLQDESTPPHALALEVRSPCHDDKNRYSYYCFELGAPGASCETTCDDRDIDTAGMTLTNGGNSHCANVVNRILSSSYSVNNLQPGLGLGCALQGILIRDSNEDPAAFFDGARRVCACVN